MRALVQPYDFIMLDEPISHLDNDNARVRGQIVMEEARKQGAGVVNGKNARFKGRVIGFSSRLNSILVPQTFMEWSNKDYFSDSGHSATCLIVEVDNPIDIKVSEFMESHG